MRLSSCSHKGCLLTLNEGFDKWTKRYQLDALCRDSSRRGWEGALSWCLKCSAHVQGQGLGAASENNANVLCFETRDSKSQIQAHTFTVKLMAHVSS